MIAYFNRFNIKMTMREADSCSHTGPCDEDVKAFLHTDKIRRQMSRIKATDIRDELKEYGAWDDDELLDDEYNRERILWIAAGNIKDEAHR